MDNRMKWEQKLQALQSLAITSIRMRSPGNWYVSHSIEVKDGSLLKGTYGEGKNPQEAILNDWNLLTNLREDQYLVINAMSKDRKAIKWNGFMWDKVYE